jgi:bacterioferritin
MKHAEKLIDCILFLEGLPIVNEGFTVTVGKDVKEILENDLSLEREGLPELKRGIALCIEQADTGIRELLEHLLVDGFYSLKVRLMRNVSLMCRSTHKHQKRGISNFAKRRMLAPSVLLHPAIQVNIRAGNLPQSEKNNSQPENTSAQAHSQIREIISSRFPFSQKRQIRRSNDHPCSADP